MTCEASYGDLLTPGTVQGDAARSEEGEELGRSSEERVIGMKSGSESKISKRIAGIRQKRPGGVAPGLCSHKASAHVSSLLIEHQKS